MLITKFTHSCVRLEKAGRVLVIDPGMWSEAGALLGADAVLVTHEHVDHVDPVRLAGIGAPVFAPAGADLPALAQVREFDLHRLEPGDAVDVADLRQGIPRSSKIGFPGAQPGRQTASPTALSLPERTAEQQVTRCGAQSPDVGAYEFSYGRPGVITELVRMSTEQLPTAS